MPIIKQNIIKRSDLKENRDKLYVFGDNMAQSGFGGQAKEMRGEPNAVGIPTKWKPDTKEDSYFNPQDINNHLVQERLRLAFDRIRLALDLNTIVVIPTDGIGTGLAELTFRAPVIYKVINWQLSILRILYAPPAETG